MDEDIREVLSGILGELRVINTRLAAVEGAVLDESGRSLIVGLQMAVGEFHHDVEAKNNQQDQAIERNRERLNDVNGRVRDLEASRQAG